MSKSKLEKAERLEEEIQRLKNEKKIVLQQHREQERKARTHRICKRGALLESILPESVDLTDEQLKILLEKTLQSNFARNRIEEMQSPKKSPAVAPPEKTEFVGTGDDVDYS